jgi:uncharacterized protein YbjT (DUF2867 family)|tara:strand:- start:1383 stop:2000 length:618 start_codon:yes stop_codon:yes gene_type:complete
MALCSQIRNKNYALYAVTRSKKNNSELESIQAKIMLADALDKEQVIEVLSKIDNRSIVVSLVGGQNAELAIRSDFPANKNIIDACEELGFSRFIFVTSIGAGESEPQLPDMLKPFLGPVAKEKTKAENVLRSSNLEYTIIRPGQLTNDSATGNGILTEECILGSMTRQDLASMVMKAIDNDETIGKIYSTLDQHKDPDFSWMQNR